MPSATVVSTSQRTRPPSSSGPSALPDSQTAPPNSQRTLALRVLRPGHWPGCSPGFVHANYVMLGRGHSDYMDAVVVERIADLINEACP